MVNKKLDTSQQCVLAAEKSTMASRAREGTLPLCPTLLRPPRSPASSSGTLSTGQSWSCGSGAGGGPSNDARAGTPLLGGKSGRAGAGQPGEEKAEGRPYCGLPVPKGDLSERRDILPRPVMMGQGATVLN